ncbi:MAG: hypothetical protein JSU83_04775 [Deltaproteobacteria bacterium]|nr:MAG: hypothetical protein JSU83_04775 [Deltaproteobacteria bacterium]
MKKLWLTSVGRYEDLVQKLMSQMKTYGFEVNGHFWKDDLDQLAFLAVRDELLDSKIALWGILASDEDLSKPTIRYGLSLLAIAVQAQRGLDFPILVLQTGEEQLIPEKLTTPLNGVDVLTISDPGLGAKLVTNIHRPVGEISSDYRLDIYGTAQIGQWFEIGPESTSWPGAMFGVAGGEITFHAVGPKGELPSQSVLNYPMKGLKLNLGEKEYTAWAVQNELDAQASYFVKVEGFPESMVFGPYSTEEAADVFVVKLK